MIHTFLAHLSVASNLYANKTFVDGVERHVLDGSKRSDMILLLAL